MEGIVQNSFTSARHALTNVQISMEPLSATKPKVALRGQQQRSATSRGAVRVCRRRIIMYTSEEDNKVLIGLGFISEKLKI